MEIGTIQATKKPAMSAINAVAIEAKEPTIMRMNIMSPIILLRSSGGVYFEIVANNVGKYALENGPNSNKDIISGIPNGR